jgi:glycosyltransferase involved in cell wall biosynthesis
VPLILKETGSNAVLHIMRIARSMNIFRRSNRNQKVYIFDPALINSTGHHSNAYTLIDLILSGMGIESEGFGNVSLDRRLSSQPGLHAHFTRSSYSDLASIYNDEIACGNSKNAAQHFLKALISTRVHKSSRDNIYIFPTIMHFHLLAIDEWIRQHDGSDRQTLIIWLLFDETFMTKSSRQENWAKQEYVRAFAKFDELASNGTKIFFVAETQAMADHFRQMTDCPIALAPLQYGALEASSMSGVAGESAERVRVTFAGNSRYEKGFFLLPDIIERVWEFEPGVNFIVHADLASAPTELNEVIARLRSFGDRVELISGALSSSAYYEILKSSSILIMPYDSKAYRNRGSGIALEAIALGIPSVVPAAASFAGELLNLGMATAFNKQSANEISKAVIEAIRTLPTLRQNGLAHLEARTNRPSAIEMLLENVVKSAT